MSYSLRTSPAIRNARPRLPHRLTALFVSIAWSAPALSADHEPTAPMIDRGGMPYRVHVIEDYETEIERRWWLRGQPETTNVPPSLSPCVPNRRCCRATETKDFDRKMGDQSKAYKAVIFNPVPGPPMGKNTRLTFRYWIGGTDKLRVQIYSLTNGYHRRLFLTDSPQRQWQAATVDMNLARRPDGSGGPLSEDERIDDIQFYVPPDAELLIDDIVLFDAATESEERPFPHRPIFTGWFDTGQQGKEWPGDFEIVLHEKPLTWDAARSVANDGKGRQWIRVSMRGQRPLGARTRLRFRYHLLAADSMDVILVNSATNDHWRAELQDLEKDIWQETHCDFTTPGNKTADEIRFLLPADGSLYVDDLLLFEPE